MLGIIFKSDIISVSCSMLDVLWRNDLVLRLSTNNNKKNSNINQLCIKPFFNVLHTLGFVAQSFFFTVGIFNFLLGHSMPKMPVILAIISNVFEKKNCADLIHLKQWRASIFLRENFFLFNVAAWNSCLHFLECRLDAPPQWSSG